MDNIRGEVSNKIRSAIKAKLMELGAYVDDELPDYIMVMVANKRSRQQMEDDLLLFLGDSTTTFTSWLHTVLSKLQQVTVNSADLKKGFDKKRPSSDDHKKDKRKKIKKEKEKETDKPEGPEKVSDKNKNKDLEVETIESPLKLHPVKAEVDFSIDEGTDPSKKHTVNNPVLLPSTIRGTQSKKSVDSRINDDEDEDDCINLKADVETDMWGEPEEISCAAVKTSDSKSTQPPPNAAGLVPRLPENQDKQAPKASRTAEGKIDLNSSTTEEPRSTSRIIKISETIRQEQETLKPSPKVARDPQALARRVFQSHIVSQQNVRDKPERSRRRSSSSHRSDHHSRRNDPRNTRRNEREDLRETLRKERLREREQSRDRERERRRSRGESKPSKSQSAVASVVRTPLSHKDDNEPDPSLSSVVRVKPRPQLPAALQANRSLILKAVAEAQKSVSKAAIKSEVASKLQPKPLQLKKKSMKDRIQLPKQPSVKIHSASKRDQTESKQLPCLPPRETLQRMSFTVLSKPAAPSKESSTHEFGDVSDEGSVIVDPSLSILIQVPAAPAVEKCRKSPDNIQAENVRRWIKDVEEATKSEIIPDANSDQDAETDVDPFAVMETISKPGSNEDPDDYDEVLDAETSSLKVSDIQSADMSGNLLQRLNNGPQFVVTLDGLDPLLLQSYSMEEGKTDEIIKELVQDSGEEVMLEDKQEDLVKEQLLRQELLRQQAAVRERKSVRPSVTTLPPPSVAVKRPISPSSSLDTRPLKVITSKAANTERCKFWPSCKNGDKCEFHHPTVQCKLFPSCKFADRCLYIHPNCRFNTACTRVDCPYTHTGPKSVHSPPPIGVSHTGAQPIKQACKFFPNCSNHSCPFLHPTVCKFGTHCTKPKCQFIHSDKGLNTKHKWVRQ